MTSLLAWLDQSADEQRRVRELVRLFTEADSRDELGIGQIRDVFSNRLFPGTSVIQTRTRYFLFIPWLFQAQAAKRRSGGDLLRRVHLAERKLIETLKAPAADGSAKDLDGLIGAMAGAQVKTLPSAIYWGGLTRYDILTRPLAADELGTHTGSESFDPDAADERAGRAPTDWHPTIPAPPADFPDVVDGFTMRPEEASWFRDVLLEAAPESLLAHLFAAAESPSTASDGPWTDPVALGADAPIRELIDEARLFSLVIYGASLLYNLLLAEAYDDAGLDRIIPPVDEYRDRLDVWALDLEGESGALGHWDLPAWWTALRIHNPRISPGTQHFVDEWVRLIRSGAASSLASNPDARELICRRERAQKKAQARLANERLLRTWSGASGAFRLDYRWGTVRQLVTDVVSALEPARAGA